jgi:phosphatidate phosphatase LPIN
MDLLNDTNSQPQEYSWEWGAFPQPSSIKASFSKGGRIESNKALWGTGRKGRTNTVKKSRLGGMTLPPMIRPSSDQNQEQDEEGLGRAGLRGRSRSVPPLLEGDLSRKGRRASRELKEYEDADAHLWPEYQGNIDFGLDADNQRGGAVIFGTGGALNASEDDPTTLVLSIDGRKVEFQLSLVGGDDDDDHNSLKRRGRGEMEAARLFDSARIDLIKLLDDEDVVRDPRLVIRWARDQYVPLPFVLTTANTRVMIDI